MSMRAPRLAATMAAAVILVLGLAISVQSPPVRAGSDIIVVTTTDDELNADGDCSLREAIVAANTNAAVDACAPGTPGLDVIQLEATTYALAIAGAEEDMAATGDLDILEPVHIMANRPGAVIDAAGLDRVFDIAPGFAGGSFSLLTMRNGDAGTGDGGGVRLGDACGGTTSTVSLIGVILEGNRAASGGGIHLGPCQDVEFMGVSAIGNAAESTGGAVWTGPGSYLFVQNSTFSGNTAGTSGGAIWASPGAALSIVFATIAHNEAPAAGALASIGASLANVNTTVIAHNDTPACAVTSLGGDQSISDDPSCPTTLSADNVGLEALTTVAGYPIHPLARTSPARDVDASVRCPGELQFDQVGNPRPQDGDGDGIAACDAGAVEASAVALVPSPTPPAPLPDTAVPSPRPSAPIGLLAAWIVIGASLIVRPGLTRIRRR
jgi:CSLREA domain-containing protein